MVLTARLLSASVITASRDSEMEQPHRSSEPRPYGNQMPSRWQQEEPWLLIGFLMSINQWRQFGLVFGCNYGGRQRLLALPGSRAPED